jgi:hypothetical protein
METFSKEQDEIFNKYISGKNIFITGLGPSPAPASNPNSVPEGIYPPNI